MPPVLSWSVLDATWVGETREACRPGGACWVFVKARLNQFIYGFYPVEEQWRVDLSALLLVVGVGPLMMSRMPAKGWWALGTIVLYPAISLLLLVGGITAFLLMGTGKKPEPTFVASLPVPTKPEPQPTKPEPKPEPIRRRAPPSAADRRSISG